MTTRVWFDISNDAVYMVQYSGYPDGSGERRVMMPDGSVRSVPKSEPFPPEAKIQIHRPQELLDALIAEGIRPSSNAWSSGHVAALEKHIQFAEKVVDSLLPKHLERT